MQTKMIETIFQYLGLIGFGTFIGSVVTYFLSKKLKKFETKLIIFRRVYRQLYYVILIHQEQIDDLKNNEGIKADEICYKSGLDVTKDLGDILFYVEGELEKMIAKLIYSLYHEGAILGKSDFDNIAKIMQRLKKTI